MANSKRQLPMLYLLVRDLLRVNPQQPGGRLSCTYCGVRLFGTSEELQTLKHRPRCAWARAMRYLVEVERSLGLTDGPGLRDGPVLTGPPRQELPSAKVQGSLF